MSEVEKLYKNTGVEKWKDCKHYLRGDGNWCNDTCDIDKGQGTYSDICYLGDNHDKNDIDRLKCPYCEVEDFGYPPFTAEKQIELIKVIANRECFVANYVPKRNIFILSSEDFNGTQIKFSDALAELINNLWQDLTEQERTEIAEILRG